MLSESRDIAFMHRFCIAATLFWIFAAAEEKCDKVLLSTVDSLSTRIASSCEAGSIMWEKPHGSQSVTFLKNTSFTLCLSSNSTSSPVAIYRLIGPSRRLLIPKYRTGILGCYDSECNHISILIESYNSSGHIELKYETNTTTKCPRCSESCQMMCFCTAPYVFTAEVVQSTSEYGQFSYYVKIMRVIKNDGVYIPTSLKLPGDQCLPRTAHSASHYLVDVQGQLPSTGLVQIFTTYTLNVGAVYLVSARLHSGPRPGLVLCCADNDDSYAISYLEDLLETRKCCL